MGDACQAMRGDNDEVEAFRLNLSFLCVCVLCACIRASVRVFLVRACRYQLKRHPFPVNAIAWAPHSDIHIATAGEDMNAFIWHLESPRFVESGDPLLEYVPIVRVPKSECGWPCVWVGLPLPTPNNNNVRVWTSVVRYEVCPALHCTALHCTALHSRPFTRRRPH